MLINMKEMLAIANKNHFAVGAFNATESSLFRSVVEEAEAQDAPAIVQVAPGEFEGASGRKQGPLRASSGPWQKRGAVHEGNSGRFYIGNAGWLRTSL